MIASGHNSIGAILGLTAYQLAQTSNNPWYMVWPLVFIAGIASHYLADALPHGHYNWQIHARGGNKRFNKALLPAMIIDGLGTIVVFCILSAVFISKTSVWYVLFAIFAAQLPDFIMLFNNLSTGHNSRLIKLEQNFHGGIVHWHDLPGDKPRPWGWSDAWQIMLSMVAVMLIIGWN